MPATISKLIDMINDNKIVPEMLNSFNKLNVHFYQKSKDNKYLFCNDAIANATGLNINNDMIGQTDFDWIAFGQNQQNS